MLKQLYELDITSLTFNYFVFVLKHVSLLKIYMFRYKNLILQSPSISGLLLQMSITVSFSVTALQIQRHFTHSCPEKESFHYEVSLKTIAPFAAFNIE